MTQPLRVLFVEDSEDDVALLSLALRRGDFDPAGERVDNPADLRLALFERGPWDIVLADYHLPRMMVSTVIDLVREKDADLPLIVVTGTVGEETAIELMRGGVADLVLKTRLSRLVPAIQRELASSRERRGRRLAEESNLAAQAQLGAVANNILGVIYRRRLDPDGTVSYPYVSGNVHSLFGLRSTQSIGRDADLVGSLVDEDQADYLRELAKSERELAPFSVDVRVVVPGDGEIRWLRLRARPERLRDGAVLWDGIALDITDLKVAQETRDYLAYHDHLTGLPNQTLLMDRLSQAIMLAGRAERRVAVLSLEIESLMSIQDSWGLAAPDSIIRQAARRLQALLDPGDTIAHFGSGHFCAVLGNVDGEASGNIPLQQLIESFAEPFLIEGRTLHAKAYFGICLYPDDADQPMVLLQNANTALHEAKSSQRPCYRFYARQMTETAVRRLSVEGELRVALERAELELFYQPQVHPLSYRITGAEALARWRHPVRGLVSPVEFIPVAEKTGLIIPLGDFVLREACSKAVEWRRSGLCEFPVSVNVSGLQLMRPDFGDFVLRTIAETGLPPSGLKLELTESTIVRHDPVVTRTMERLAEHGICFAVDDFGIEHASLSHLSQLPIDTIKLDHYFVARMTVGTAHAALAQAIVAMTHAMHKTAIAEGVETMEELTYLRAYQCDALQGFLFSRPVPPDEMELLLKGGTLSPRPHLE